MLFLGAGLLIKPGLLIDIMGFIIVAALFLMQKRREASMETIYIEARERR
jgi:UPF0716 family protein affecting phage T7 exclusion